MRIVEKEKVPVEVTYKCTCHECGVIIEYVQSELTFKSHVPERGGIDWRSNRYAIFNCLNCYKPILVGMQ
jgi:hypothetical protein